MTAEQIGQIVGTVLGVAFAVAIFWVVPVAGGIHTARRRNRSPHWMWFGIHPFGGWIAFLVLLSLSARKRCPGCAELAAERANLCPFCGHSFNRDVDRPAAIQSAAA